ncbi:MAG: hypothetical protein EAZ37_04645 [Burkholderiales bacterium]|nr:MAG: hypothetical protein EAZ37_04645 [Burkholderiales bacterium]
MSGVKTQIPDFGLVYYAVLETPSGDTYEIREQDFLTAIKSGHLFAPAFNDIEALHRPMMKNLGDLMYWPVAPLFAASWVNSAIRSTLNML